MIFLSTWAAPLLSTSDASAESLCAHSLTLTCTKLCPWSFHLHFPCEWGTCLLPIFLSDYRDICDTGHIFKVSVSFLESFCLLMACFCLWKFFCLNVGEVITLP